MGVSGGVPVSLRRTWHFTNRLHKVILKPKAEGAPDVVQAKRIKDRAYDMPRPGPYDPNSVWKEFTDLAEGILRLMKRILGEDDGSHLESEG